MAFGKRTLHISKIVLKILAGILLLAAFASCDLSSPWSKEELANPGGSDPSEPTEPIDPRKIDLSADSFTLTWDPVSGADSYRLYYRVHGTSGWTELDELASGTPEFVINSSILDYGTYDFAVSTLAGGEESELHTSLDSTADPSTGWFLYWLPQA